MIEEHEDYVEMAVDIGERHYECNLYGAAAHAYFALLLALVAFVLIGLGWLLHP